MAWTGAVTIVFFSHYRSGALPAYCLQGKPPSNAGSGGSGGRRFFNPTLPLVPRVNIGGPNMMMAMPCASETILLHKPFMHETSYIDFEL